MNNEDMMDDKHREILELKGMLKESRIAYDQPTSAEKSLRDAWQRACDKRGEQYADDIFPGGRPPESDARPHWQQWAETASRLQRELVEARATAAELLAALELALPYVESVVERKGDVADFDCDVIRAAIARAEKGAQ